jgi:hypothetical protein
MRTRIKRRQRVRRLTILATLLIVVASLAVGTYLVSISNGGTSRDSKINQPVSSSDLASLQRASFQPYGPAPAVDMQNTEQRTSGSPYLSNGKPVVLYIGAEFCQYCAIERWALIMALMRFGNFTSLHYMTSAPSEGDTRPSLSS